MAEMLGFGVEEMLGRSAFDFIYPALHAELERHLEVHRQGIKEVYEFQLRRKDGAELWVITSVTPLFDAHGQFNGAFAMLTDITERHRFEEYQQEFARKTIEAATEGKLMIRGREEIMQMTGPPIMSWEITGADDLEHVRHAAMEIVLAAGMDEERAFDFILCISEAVTNTVKHAGGGTLSLHRVDETVLAVVSDRGPGIPAINLPEVALKRGYTTAVSLGMGYKAMISMADTVYLATGPGGTTVAIAMALHALEPPPVTIPALPSVW
jgi:PAS domain S-box-containing protein